MNNYVILADVTCDLSPEIRSAFGITDYVQGHIHFSDGRDFPTTLDWSHISRDEFYKTLAGNKIQISTAPASPEEYYQIFRKYASQGISVLSMSISSKISSTYQAACSAAERVRKEFPNCNIYCYDSYKMSGALGLLVMHASTMKREGKTFDEVVTWLEASKHKVHQMGPIDDLIFVARRGRITMGKAIMGSFAGVKPMGDCNRDGYVTVLTKAKGMTKALDLTVRYIERTATDLSQQFILISHSNRAAYAEKLKEKLEQALPVKKVYICDVFSGCGTNIGPGMVCAYFLGEELSENLVTEKAIMDQLLNG